MHETTDHRQGLRAASLLRVRAVWTIPVVVAVLFVALMTSLYVGATVDPAARVRHLPVVVVNDAGPAGARLGSALRGAPQVASRLTLTPATRSGAARAMDRGEVYAAVVIPRAFPADRRVTLETNPRAGNVGVELATGIVQPALAAAGAGTVATSVHRPLPARSALGLSAFYVALLTLMCGFIAATLARATIDGALGYAATEIGPSWRLRRPRAISRWQTLLATWAMAVVLSGILVTVVLAMAAVLGLDMPDPLLLWAFGWFAAATVAIGTAALLAVLGAQGQLVALVVFVYAGLSLAGGTTPVEALPGVLRVLSEADPLRAILDGVRAILYFDARGDAGLIRALAGTAIGLVCWLTFGVVAVRAYDRRGLARADPDVVAELERTACAPG